MTPILTYGDMETCRSLSGSLYGTPERKERRGKGSCGVHIHIGAKGPHTAEPQKPCQHHGKAMRNLIADALNLDRWRMNRYCRTVDPRFWSRSTGRNLPRWRPLRTSGTQATAQATAGMPTLQRQPLPYAELPCDIHQRERCRSRLFQFDEPGDRRRGGLHAGQLKSYIQLCLALSQMAKEVKTAKPEAAAGENPKYAMRTWLLRLSFIGDEFKTARTSSQREACGGRILPQRKGAA